MPTYIIKKEVWKENKYGCIQMIIKLIPIPFLYKHVKHNLSPDRLMNYKIKMDTQDISKTFKVLEMN